jgi:hypothetical protein
MNITFTFPYNGELLIKEGDKVDFETPLYKQQSREEVIIHLAKMLNTSPNKIFQSLKKFVGEPVHKGEVVAEKSSFVTKKKYLSEYEGIMKEINHNQGTVTLEVDTELESTVYSFFAGEVVELKKSEKEGQKLVKVTLKTKHMKQIELKEASALFGGKVVYCKNPEKAQLTEEDVNFHIVVDDSIPSYEQIKYEALGARAFVTLHTLTEQTEAASAKMKNISDYEKLLEKPLPYCIVDKDENVIYFYE